jgi:hypothetical protein
MRAPQLVERKAELGDRAGLEVLHEHVGLGEHRREQRLVVFAREIEHQRFLAAVEPHEIRALAPRFLSACSVDSLSPHSVNSLPLQAEVGFIRLRPVNTWPNSGKPEFGCKRGRGRRSRMFAGCCGKTRGHGSPRHGELVVVAREIALGPLDLDHARAGVGEAAGAHGRRHRLLQRHHQQA